MAARTLRPRHQEEIKAKIQTTQLVKRLHDHVDGSIEMTTTQIDAAKFLLNKTLSNAPTELDATIDQSVTVEITRFSE